jgi:hypothetical protein
MRIHNMPQTPGKETKKTLPGPVWDVTQILPSCRSKIFRAHVQAPDAQGRPAQLGKTKEAAQQRVNWE